MLWAGRRPLFGKEMAVNIGVPKEIKVHEYRVGIVPSGVRDLLVAGHRVWVETGAGEGIGFSDADYVQAGARSAADAQEVFAAGDLIGKVTWARQIAGEEMQVGPEQPMLAADGKQLEFNNW